MIKEIAYNSYSASPSDYLSPDGELSCALNCIHEDGALKSLSAPKVIATDIIGDVLAIHRVPNSEHYIMRNDKVLYWAMVDDINTSYILHTFDLAIQTVTPIGNTLAALDSSGILHYILWKDDNYKYLGTQLPELDARPYLSTHIYDRTEMDSRFGIEFSEELPSATLSGTEGLLNVSETKKLYSAQTTSIALYGDVRQNVYERVFACINQFNRLFHRKGYFTAPFYARFAYRLYDGCHAMHTVPILLVPTTWGMPLPGVRVTSSGSVLFDPLFSASRLNADINLPEDFADWSDIITHVDIFVTAPAVNYTDSPESLVSISQLPFFKYTDKWEQVTEGDEPMFMSNSHSWNSIIKAYGEQEHPFILKSSYSVQDGKQYQFTVSAEEVYSLIVLDVSAGDGQFYRSDGVLYPQMAAEDIPSGLPLPEGGLYKVYSLSGSILLIYDGSDSAICRRYVSTSTAGKYAEKVHHYIELQRIDGKDYKEELTNYNSFYNVAELDLSVNSSGFGGDIPIKENILVNLVARPTLSDVAQGRSRNIVSHSFSYNNRLNVVVESEVLPSCAGISIQNRSSAMKPTISPQYMSAYVKVMENSQTAYHKLPDKSFVDCNLFYFTYPRSTATELILCSSTSRLHISLQRHPFLNLAYAFNMFNKLEGTTIRDSEISEYSNNVIKYGNKIKTSPVNNPFVFSEENTSELPVSEIFALSTAAKPLSQGQFGQFPLYAFTDEGVWALEVSATGTYLPKQPITRDVVINPSGITQIDSAVLFPTDRGIMLISGSTAQCISDILNSAELFNITEFPKSDALINIFNNRAGDARAITLNDITMLSFREFLINCRMVYDYTNQRIIVYNPTVRYAYVYSLKSKMWGMMQSNVVENVNSYPEALAMADGAKLVDFSKTDADTTTSLVITRPFKLGDPDSFKTINTIIQRGMFRSTHVRQVLYGSNDLYHWHTVWSSVDRLMRGFRGTPYKAYRLALICNFDKGENIHGCTVVFEPRMGNKVR